MRPDGAAARRAGECLRHRALRLRQGERRRPARQLKAGGASMLAPRSRHCSVLGWVQVRLRGAQRPGAQRFEAEQFGAQQPGAEQFGAQRLMPARTSRADSGPAAQPRAAGPARQRQQRARVGGRRRRWPGARAVRCGSQSLPADAQVSRAWRRPVSLPLRDRCVVPQPQRPDADYWSGWSHRVDSHGPSLPRPLQSMKSESFFLPRPQRSARQE